MLALTDGVGLDVDEAKAAMLDAARWLLTGALAELDPAHQQRPSAAQQRDLTIGGGRRIWAAASHLRDVRRPETDPAQMGDAGR